MGRKKKGRRGKVVKLPPRRTRTGEKQVNQDRKLSEIIKEMALRLFKEPDAAVSLPALEAAILLASAAWNAALGDQGLREQHREMLKKFDWDGRQPWPELVSADTDRLITGLVEYKQSRYPDDRRRIVAAETRSDGNVRVHWAEENKHELVAGPFGSTTTRAASVESSHPIAEKLVAMMKRKVRGKVVDIRSVIAGRAAAEELQKKVVSKERLAGFHPAHAAYVYAQNQVSVFSEQLTALKEMAPFDEIVSRAADLYMPSAPPMSPLTISYFTCWAFFDACVGPSDETIGTTILEVGAAFGTHPEMLRLFRQMQQSRMGLYVREGVEGKLVFLRELVTDTVYRTLVPVDYRGEEGELWYVRLLPPPLPGGMEHVAFTTPYVLLRPGLREWQAYFRRTLPDAPKQARLDAYERHMKFGPTRSYWNEFVFEAYVNHREDAIFLRGLPDIAESRPHSAENSQRFDR